MTEKEKYKERVLSKIRKRKDICSAEDGFMVYCPTAFIGFHTAESLRIIADELDRLNEPWQKQINEYFDNLAPEESAESYEF